MAFLSGIFAKIIAVFISLITFITGLFGGIFAPPVDGYVALENTLISIETGKYLIIGSYDEFIDTVGEIKNETKKYDEEYFETKSLLAFRATIPQTNYDVVCDSIVENGNTVTVNYHVENNGEIGLTMISSQAVLVEISKDIETANIIYLPPPALTRVLLTACFAHKNRITADNVYILPADAYALPSAADAEIFRSAVNNQRHHPTAGFINLNVTHKAKPAAV